MYSTTTRPAPALRPEDVRSNKIYIAVSEGLKVDPRYVDALLETIKAKIEIGEKLQNEQFYANALEEYTAVMAYKNRGSQDAVWTQAHEQERLAKTYDDIGREDLKKRALEKRDALMASWRAYQIQARF